MKELAPGQKARLKNALRIISEVQIEMMKAADKEKKKPGDYEYWRDLYWLRCKLSDFIEKGFVPMRG